MSEPFSLQTLRIGVLVNTASGSSNDSTAHNVVALLTEAGLTASKVWEIKGEELDTTLTQAQSLVDVLIVFGGDGTIRAAAERSTMDGPVLIPLPGGTMNILPKALYGDASWEDILKGVLSRPQLRTISGGRIGEERFFIAAIFGGVSRWAKVRESLREGELADAIESGKEALAPAHKIGYEFNEMHKGTAEAVVVTCPLVAETLADDRKALEATVVDAGSAEELMHLATATALGQWRDAKNVAVVATKQVVITSPEPIATLLDGESVDSGIALAVEFVPEAFRALVPNPITTKYFVDFDRTIFDTPAFKKSVARRPTLIEVLKQLKGALAEYIGPERTLSRQKLFLRTWGTFLSHGRLGFTPSELKDFIYPEVPAFLATHHVTVVTYGVEMFITAKVASALTELPIKNVIYTSRRKGRTIRKLTKEMEGPFVFVDDAHFQLDSVGRWCPEVQLYEIRRDGQPGNGRWPVITSFDELP